MPNTLESLIAAVGFTVVGLATVEFAIAAISERNRSSRLADFAAARVCTGA